MNGNVWAWLVWGCLGAVIYTYAVYPVLIFCLAAIRQTARDVHFLLARRNRRAGPREEFLPQVAMLVAAYNEESVIEHKLQNTAEIDYPANKVEFLFGLDCPSDTTPDRAGHFSNPPVKVIAFPTRRGKLAVINDLAQRTSANILAFSDANTMLEPESLRRLVRHFSDPEVGAVCGELRLASAEGAGSESLYWRYEVALKFLENRLNCVLGANGAVYAIRRELFPQLQHAIVEDFQIPMQIRTAGHRVVYDPEAIGTEESAPSMAAEFRRKIRIGAGAFQTLFGCLGFLNPFNGMPAFAYFSHKVVRWLVPFFLLVAWGGSLALAADPVFAILFAAQTVFYALSYLGWLLEQRKRAGLLKIPLYFSMMNLALLLGFFRFLGGQQKAVWSSTPRQVEAPVAPVKGPFHE